MGYLVLFVGVILGMFTITTHFVSTGASQMSQTQARQDAALLASQMIALSDAYAHWHYKNPSNTAMPSLSSLPLPWDELDSRISYSVSGGRFWVWAAESDTPGLTARLKMATVDSKLLYRWSNGQLIDLKGSSINASALTIPAALSSLSASQIIHLN